MSEFDIVNKSQQAYTESILINDFKRLGIKEGDNVLVHSSLSKLGWIVGAERTVVSALIKVIGENGTIVMPTFSGDNSDPINWQRPAVPKEWISIIHEEMPPFDPILSSTRKMGKIVDLFRHYPGVVRSYHPQISFAALGPLAHMLIDHHQLTPGFGKESPLQRMYDHDFMVLLLGIGYENCTCMHLGEVYLDNKQWVKTGSRIIENGQNIWKEYSEIEYDDSDFSIIGEAYESENKVLKEKVGQGDARYISMKSVTDFAAKWIKNNRFK